MATPSDVQRFLNFYARRIRSFWIDTESEVWLSVEVLQALQIVTDWVPGVLSPRLEGFRWESPRTMRDILGKEMASVYPNCMSLFLAPTVINLNIDVDTRSRLYSTLIQSHAKALHPRLKVLTIIDDEEGSPKDMKFIHNFLTSGLWEQLETLQLPGPEDSPYLTSSTLSHIATLPRLTKLELKAFMDQASLEHPDSIGNPQFRGRPDGAFPSLRVLTVWCGTFSGTIKVLQHFPATNNITDLECIADCGPASHEETQRAIDVVDNHFNPGALRSLIITPGRPMGFVPTIGLEPDDNDGLDITPLLTFGKLVKLHLHIWTDLRSSTPELLRRFPIAWPNMEHLNMLTYRTTTEMPLIDHSHILGLLESYPNLKHLGLRFDAGHIAGNESSPNTPFSLTTLAVGDSPISSPSRVTSFLKSNVPSLEYPKGLWLGYGNSTLKEEWSVPIHRLRWEAVAAAMGGPGSGI